MKVLVSIRRWLLALLLLAPIAALSPAAALADEYWVLGSFQSQPSARAEGRRISAESGLEVLMSQHLVPGGNLYRLLVRRYGAVADDASLRYQLQLAGISGTWTLRFDEGEEPLVLAVFSGLEASDNDMASLSSAEEPGYSSPPVVPAPVVRRPAPATMDDSDDFNLARLKRRGPVDRRAR